jgi:hypothetical protein
MLCRVGDCTHGSCRAASSGFKLVTLKVAPGEFPSERLCCYPVQFPSDYAATLSSFHLRDYAATLSLCYHIGHCLAMSGWDVRIRVESCDCSGAIWVQGILQSKHYCNEISAPTCRNGNGRAPGGRQKFWPQSLLNRCLNMYQEDPSVVVDVTQRS